MKRILLSAMVISLIYSSPILAADNLSQAAAKFKAGISGEFSKIDKDLSTSAKNASVAGFNGEEIRMILRGCCSGRPYAIDCTAVDANGVMKVVEPGPYRKFEGSKIDKQAAVKKVRETKKPVLSNVITAVEGMMSVDIEYPVLSNKKDFLGSLSILAKQEEIIRAVAVPIEKEFGVKCWVMQKDGLFIYETDPTQIGLNLFTDPLYKDYGKLIALGKKTVSSQSGIGSYSFVIHGQGDKVVKKNAAWQTVTFGGNEWILAVYKEVSK
jgi:hypothetical protein